MPCFPTLDALLFCEFHPVQGPRITWQLPQDVVSVDVFEALSEFLIPKPQLCGRLITWLGTSHINYASAHSLYSKYQRWTIMGFPVSIEDKKYERNAYLFNCAFVFENLNESPSCYELVVQKLAHSLRTLEVYLPTEAAELSPYSSVIDRDCLCFQR